MSKFPDFIIVGCMKTGTTAMWHNLDKHPKITMCKNIYDPKETSTEIRFWANRKPHFNFKNGIDLGVSSYLTDNNGNKEPNPNYTKKLEKKLARQQRILSRKKKGSNRREKQRKKVFRIHEKIRNCRADFLHNLSTKLINENQVICLEDLSVKEMIEDSNIAKEISDCSWSKFVEMLKYKADWYGRIIVEVNRYFPSSQLCSDCGNRNKDLTLKDRTWICSACGVEHDRDVNAAKNILAEGINILTAGLSGDSSLNIQTWVCSS